MLYTTLMCLVLCNGDVDLGILPESKPVVEELKPDIKFETKAVGKPKPVTKDELDKAATAPMASVKPAEQPTPKPVTKDELDKAATAPMASVKPAEQPPTEPGTGPVSTAAPPVPPIGAPQNPIVSSGPGSSSPYPPRPMPGPSSRIPIIEADNPAIVANSSWILEFFDATYGQPDPLVEPLLLKALQIGWKVRLVPAHRDIDTREESGPRAISSKLANYLNVTQLPMVVVLYNGMEVGRDQSLSEQKLADMLGRINRKDVRPRLTQEQVDAWYNNVLAWYQQLMVWYNTQAVQASVSAYYMMPNQIGMMGGPYMGNFSGMNRYPMVGGCSNGSCGGGGYQMGGFGGGYPMGGFGGYQMGGGGCSSGRCGR